MLPVDTLRFRERPRVVSRSGRTFTIACEAYDSIRPDRRAEARAIDVATFDGAALVGETGAPDRMRIAVQRRGAWSTLEWTHPTVWLVHHASVVADARGVAVIATASMHGMGSAVITFRGEWMNDTVAWSPPVRLDSLRGGFERIGIARLGSDSLVTVWHSSAGVGATARVGGADSAAATRPSAPGTLLFTALSFDSGRSWRLIEPLKSSSAMDGEMLIVDASGGTLMAIWTTGEMNAQGLAPKSRASLWTPACP